LDHVLRTVGIAHDNWLLYGKVAGAGTVPVFSGMGGQDRVGWTVGTGIEWGLWQNWSVKAEYDYIDFGYGNLLIRSALG
jgi:outer membrane immunogenic protein